MGFEDFFKILVEIEDVGFWGKVLLGKKRERESGRNSCGFRMDVKSRSTPQKLC